VRKWGRFFKEVGTSVHDGERRGNLPVLKDNLKEKTSSNIRDHRRLKICALHENCYKFVQLRGYW
jgi:hypothetical protein